MTDKIKEIPTYGELLVFIEHLERQIENLRNMIDALNDRLQGRR